MPPGRRGGGGGGEEEEERRKRRRRRRGGGGEEEEEEEEEERRRRGVNMHLCLLSKILKLHFHVSNLKLNGPILCSLSSLTKLDTGYWSWSQSSPWLIYLLVDPVFQFSHLPCEVRLLPALLQPLPPLLGQALKTSVPGEARSAKGEGVRVGDE